MAIEKLVQAATGIARRRAIVFQPVIEHPRAGLQVRVIESVVRTGIDNQFDRWPVIAQLATLAEQSAAGVLSMQLADFGMIRVRICAVGQNSDYGAGRALRWHQTSSRDVDRLEQKLKQTKHLIKEGTAATTAELHQNLMRFRRKTGTNLNAALIWLSCLSGAIGE